MFLFEETTKLIIDELTKGNSVNLYGEVGSGKSRVLEDIKTIEKENLKVININIGVHSNNFDGFKEELKSAFHEKNIKNLSSILTHIEDKNLNYFLLLNNFDKLLGKEIDKGFDNRFLSFLNAMKNHSKISLLLVTQKRYSKDSAIYINGKSYTSNIDISQYLQIQPLTKEIILKELKKINLSETKKGEIANFIINFIEKEKYQFLKEVILKIKTLNSVDINLLEEWKKEFIKNDINISTIVKTKNWFIDKFAMLGIKKPQPLITIANWVARRFNGN